MHLTVDTSVEISQHFYTSLPKCFSHWVLKSWNISRISATCMIIIITGIIFGMVGNMTVTEIRLQHLHLNLLRKNFCQFTSSFSFQFFLFSFFFNTCFNFGFLERCRLTHASCPSEWEAEGLLYPTSGALGLSSLAILAESNWHPSVSVITFTSPLPNPVNIVGLSLLMWQMQKHDIFFWSDFENSLKEGAYNNTVLGQLFHNFTLIFFLYVVFIF